MKFFYKEAKIFLLDARGYEMQSPVPGIDCFFWNCWPVSSPKPQTSQGIVDALHYLPELHGKVPLLRLIHALGIEHGKIRLLLT